MQPWRRGITRWIGTGGTISGVSLARIVILVGAPLVGARPPLLAILKGLEKGDA